MLIKYSCTNIIFEYYVFFCYLIIIIFLYSNYKYIKIDDQYVYSKILIK